MMGISLVSQWTIARRPITRNEHNTSGRPLEMRKAAYPANAGGYAASKKLLPSKPGKNYFLVVSVAVSFFLLFFFFLVVSVLVF